MNLDQFISSIYSDLPQLSRFNFPWDVTNNLEEIIKEYLNQITVSEYIINNNIAIHHTAIIEENAIIKPNTIIGKNSIVKAGAYLRNGVFICNDVSIGTNCEIKQSLIFNKARIAHLNYVGNSIIGEDVNLEAGSIAANHFNEREGDSKIISVLLDNKIVNTKCVKFGSLIGDKSRIGANAVLNPGTILKPSSIVGRLTLVDQVGEN